MIIIRQTVEYALEKGTEQLSKLYCIVHKATEERTPWFSGKDKGIVLNLNDDDFDEHAKTLIENGKKNRRSTGKN